MSLTTQNARARTGPNQEWAVVVDIPSSNTLVEARNKLKLSLHQKWKWARSPGNGKTSSVFQCNAHVDCGHHRMAVRVEQVFLVKQMGDHAEEENLKRRSNSTLPFAEEDKVRRAVDEGTRPGTVLVSMTKEKLRELKAMGEDPLQHKRPDGGLKGATWCSNDPEYAEYMHILHILGVFLAYSCIFCCRPYSDAFCCILLYSDDRLLYSCADVPTLAQLQQTKKEMKRAKVAGVQITTLLELQHFTNPLLMPPSFSTFSIVAAADEGSSTAMTELAKQVVCIPQPAVYQTTGVCLTGPMQIGWLKQLMDMPFGFVLHGDGKHKLHHGGWILITIGTHTLRWDDHNKTLSHQFAPLMYLFCKEHESAGCCMMVVDALNVVCLKYFGAELVPGGTCSDHSDGFKLAFTKAFPRAPFGQCWPHIIRKWGQGEYAKKTWVHFDEVAPHLLSMHLATTDAMRDLLMIEIGDLWDEWGTHMNTFWNSYCKDGWDNWHMGVFQCMLATPNQNCQESWHNHLKDSKIPGIFRSSTETLFKDALPQLIEMDAILLPTELNFKVPQIPKQVMDKALWYVDHKGTHILEGRDEDGEKMWYVMRRDNKSNYKKIEKRLIEMFEAAAKGELDRRIKDLEHLMDICQLIHIVKPYDVLYGNPICEGNPMRLACLGCKGYQHSGICSHVLAVNHISQQFDIRAQVVRIGKSKKAKAGPGNVKRVAPALTRLPAPEPDSSDEEQARLLLQGQQGA